MRRYLIASVGGALFGLVAGLIVRIVGTERRWKFPTTSANDLAILAAILTIVLAYVTFRARVASFACRNTASRRAYALASIVALAAAAFSEAALLGSCSRGGLVAMISAVILLASMVQTSYRPLAAFLLLSLIVSTPLVPRTLDRVSTDPRSDASIETRVNVMRDASVMLVDAPWGVGGERFADVHERWYLEKPKEVRIWHPLNDGLWLGVERGILAMAAYYCLFFVPIIGSICLMWSTRRAETAPLADRVNRLSDLSVISCCLLIFLVGGMFTTLCRPKGISWLLLALVVIAYPMVLLSYRALKPGLRTILVALVATLTTLLLGVGFWLALGYSCRANYPWQPTRAADGLEASPRFRASSQDILVVRSERDSDSEICRLVLRHLASHGFTTRLASDNTLIGLDASEPWTSSSGVIFLPGTESLSETMANQNPGICKVPSVFVEHDPNLVDRIPEYTHAMFLYGKGSYAKAINGFPRADENRILDVIEFDGVSRCWPRLFQRYQNAIYPWLKSQLASSPRHK